MIKRVYILPTGHGFAFLGLVVVIILVASASGNNLVYGLGFMLFAVFMLVMILTNSNLQGLEVEWPNVQETFAKEPGFLLVVLKNSSRKPKYGLQGRVKGQPPQNISHLDELGSGVQKQFAVECFFERRGIFQQQKMILSTVYPLGLFRSWATLTIEEPVYVYPPRQGRLPLEKSLLAFEAKGEMPADAKAERDDFQEHSRWQPGESQHQVDWKVYARHGKMLMKRYSSLPARHFILDWRQVGILDEEERLNQFSQWISHLQNSADTFELRLPRVPPIQPGQGQIQGRACLRQLLLFAETGGKH